VCFRYLLPPWIPSIEASFAYRGRAKALFLGSFLSGVFMYFVVGTLMALPAMFKVSHWKIQPNKSLDWSKLLGSMPLIVFNFLLAQLLGPLAFLALLPEHAWDMQQLPSTSTLARHIVIWLAVEEVIFFYLHRWMHENKKMYAAIHKLHHTWTAPISYVAIYCHPIEHVLCNMLPFLLGPILCGSHIMAAGIYLLTGIIHTMGVHSGYWICDDNGMHDLHHEKFNFNYGVLGVMDTLYGSFQLPVGAAEATKTA
jgi:methylsterol monooxygenase